MLVSIDASFGIHRDGNQEAVDSNEALYRG